MSRLPSDPRTGDPNGAEDRATAKRARARKRTAALHRRYPLLFDTKVQVGLAMLVVSFYVSKSLLESAFQPLGYAVLASLSRRVENPDEYPVRVIDISELIDRSGAAMPTPGNAIVELIDQLNKKLTYAPRSVGIDINMGPDPLRPSLTASGAPVAEPSRIYGDHRVVIEDAAKGSYRFPIILGVDQPGVDPRYALFPKGSDREDTELGMRVARNVAFLNTYNHPLIVPVFIQRGKYEPRMYSMGAMLAASIVGNTGVEGNVMHAFLKDQMAEESELPKGWLRDFAYMDYGILRDWEHLVYRAEAARGLDKPGGIPTWHLALSPNVVESLNRSLERLRAMGRPYTILIGMGNALHRSTGDAERASPVSPGEDHGLPPASVPDFFIGQADPWGVPLKGSIFPGIAEHAAFVATAVVSPVIRMNGAVGFLVELLLACLYMGLVFRMDQREVKRSKADAAAKARLSSAKTPARVDSAPISARVEGAGPVAPEPSEEAKEIEEIEAEAPFWKRRVLRVAVMLAAAGLALLLRAAYGIYWDGWVLVIVFMLMEDLVGEICEACLGWLKIVIKNWRRSKWVTV